MDHQTIMVGMLCITLGWLFRSGGALGRALGAFADERQARLDYERRAFELEHRRDIEERAIIRSDLSEFLRRLDLVEQELRRR